VLSKLGGLLLSSLSDTVTGANNLRFQGKGLADAYGETLSGYLEGRGEGERRHVAFLLGEGYDGILDRLVSPYAATDGPVGSLSRLSTLFFRLGGAAWFTDVGRAAFARIMAADMGHHAGSAWGALPGRYRHVLTLQGIGGDRWEVLRAAAWCGEGTVDYLTPDRVAELPLEAMDPLIADELEAVRGLGGLPDDELPPLPARVDPDFRAEGPPRPGWSRLKGPGEGGEPLETFPDAVVQRYGRLREVREHPDHAAAKAGDREAAARLVRDLLRDGPMRRLEKALACPPVEPGGRLRRSWSPSSRRTPGAATRSRAPTPTRSPPGSGSSAAAASSRRAAPATPTRPPTPGSCAGRCSRARSSRGGTT
jgi:hypothetical protein